jgi:hypothetical protein
VAQCCYWKFADFLFLQQWLQEQATLSRIEEEAFRSKVNKKRNCVHQPILIPSFFQIEDTTIWDQTTLNPNQQSPNPINNHYLPNQSLVDATDEAIYDLQDDKEVQSSISFDSEVLDSSPSRFYVLVQVVRHDR